MNRQTARLTGKLTYDDEGGCRNGHVPTKRYVSTGNCFHCAKQRNGFTHMRVKLRPDQIDVFTAMCKALGVPFAGKTHPIRDSYEEDVTGKIPYV